MKVKSIIVASALLLAYGGAAAVELPQLPDKEGADVKGYVHNGTEGIPGVLVSDGFSFATTGADGSYYLTSSDKAWCVFAVLPSGYEYGEVEQGITKHFVTIDRSAEHFQADFRLNPIGDDNEFSFMAHADTQPDEGIAANCWRGMTTAYTDMQKTGMEIKEEEGFMPFNLHMGDIIYNTNSIVRNYDQYKQNLQATGYTIPILSTPGNHDRRYNTDYMTATATYRGTWGPTWYAFNRGKIHFIAIDNVLVESDGDYTRGFPAGALDWLSAYLKYLEKGSSVVLFTHQPMTRNNTSTKAYKKALEMLKDYNVLILTGHLHRTFKNFPEYAPGMREHNLTALAGYEWRGPCSTDGTPQGYYIYHVNGTDISWKFKWTGKNADENLFRLYQPGSVGAPSFKADEDKTIYVNVWDWDKNWRVTWELDGRDMGELPRYESEKDPWAAYCYENNPSRPQYTGNPTTYHVFHADVPASGSSVTVNVTDAFGRTATSSIQVPSGIESVSAETCGVVHTDVYNLQGVKVLTVDGYPYAETLPLDSGCYIFVKSYNDGTVDTEKQMLR